MRLKMLKLCENRTLLRYKMFFGYVNTGLFRETFCQYYNSFIITSPPL